MEIYKLGVVEVPTNRPVARLDEHDQVYRTAREKYEGVVKSIQEAHEKGQPILVDVKFRPSQQAKRNVVKCALAVDITAGR